MGSLWRPWTANSILMNLIVGQFAVGTFRIYASLLAPVFAAILGYVLDESVLGQQSIRPRAVTSTRLARVWMHVAQTKILLFISTAVISRLYAGVTSSIRVSAANPNSGTGYELEVIAMVVVDGSAWAGGAQSLGRISAC